MTTESILTQLDRAIDCLLPDEKLAIQLMQQSNIKKASDTIQYQENAGAILYELKLQLLADIQTKQSTAPDKIRTIKKFQAFAADHARNPSWKYAYHSVEDNLYLLMCDYWMIVANRPDGMELIGKPEDYKPIDWKSYNNRAYEHTIDLPNPQALELYIKSQKGKDKTVKLHGVPYIFPNGIVMNSEWLLWSMKLTEATKLKYNDIRKPCQISGAGYTITLMPAMNIHNTKPTELPKVGRTTKSLF